MKALVYHGTGQKKLEDMPKPSLREATDAVVRITKTTICGTDLRFLKGDVATVAEGRILGHEGIGVIDEVWHRWPGEDHRQHLHREGARTLRIGREIYADPLIAELKRKAWEDKGAFA